MKKPEIEFTLNSQGITIFSKRLKVPVFLKFEKNNCEFCKGACSEVDYSIDPKGITVYNKNFTSPNTLSLKKRSIFNRAHFLK